ncbi:hypothetical protein [uncultured Winogradskyella sp.]|uniref:hypothetical protein n=1 Tax=uncultured Winogradskyella sp. TaxID=395353 RepID=UPI002635CF8A|nr:hypothetical protein [uncultured Winogradskyella sp.]|tara:strand:- start:3486 stop:4169 length:684 start_codon:yes stop_codon:yes gene_type:complete
MHKISNYILKLSPKKLAIYLIIFPLIVIAFHTILSVSLRNLKEGLESQIQVISILLIVVFILFALVFLLWILWLRATTLSVEHSKLGIPVKWFRIAFGLFLFYLLYNLVYEALFAFLSNSYDNYTWVLYATRETINFVGLIVLYPIICHYSARAIYVKKNNSDATFVNSTAYTLLLIFIPISIPFFQKYFSPNKTVKNTLVKIYALALGILTLLVIIAFIATINGAL